MANRDDHHDQSLVLNQANDAIVANAVGPELILIAAQRLAQSARVAACNHALLEIVDPALLDCLVELAQLVAGVRPKLNPPTRAPA